MEKSFAEIPIGKTIDDRPIYPADDPSEMYQLKAKKTVDAVGEKELEKDQVYIKSGSRVELTTETGAWRGGFTKEEGKIAKKIMDENEKQKRKNGMFLYEAVDSIKFGYKKGTDWISFVINPGQVFLTYRESTYRRKK